MSFSEEVVVTDETVWIMHPNYNNPNKDFKRDYDLKEELGKGSFGTVRRCIYKGRHQTLELAAKITNVPEYKNSAEEEARISIELSRQLTENVSAFNSSPFIVNIFDSIVEGNIVYNIYEMANGRDLRQKIDNKQFLTLNEAAIAFYQIMKGVHHIHQRGYIHRDLKPANILLKSKAVKHYKVADFGLSIKRWKDSSGEYCVAEHGDCGSPGYTPAEGFDGGLYDIDFDTFSCGVILYEMLSGYRPFWDNDINVQNNLIRQGTFTFPNPEWSSPQFNDAKKMIELMITTQVNREELETLQTLPFYRWAQTIQPQINERTDFSAHILKSRQLRNEMIANYEVQHPTQPSS